MRAFTAVKSGDGFELWHQVTCRQFSVTQCRSVVERDFRAQISMREFGALGIFDYLSQTPPDDLITVTRRPADIRKDHRDHFQLWLMLAGQSSLAQQDRTARVETGDLMLQDQSLPFDLELGQLAHALMVVIPRSLLSSRLPTTNRLGARRISGESQIGILIASIVRQLSQMEDPMDDRAQGRLAASLLDILATALEQQNNPPSGGFKRQHLLDKVKQHIIANLHDSELDLEAIASARNIAPRTLNRLFAKEGTTPIRWLWQQRLAASYSALCEGKTTRVTDIALDFGFKDLSHFCRTFKATYGRSPRSLMRRKAH